MAEINDAITAAAENKSFREVPCFLDQIERAVDKYVESPGSDAKETLVDYIAGYVDRLRTAHIKAIGRLIMAGNMEITHG